MLIYKFSFKILPVYFLMACLLLPAYSVSAEPKAEPKGLTPRKSADFVHAVIEAGRQVYSDLIVDRLSKNISLKSVENWEEENALLLPAQFLLKSSQISNKRGIGMRYYLTSLWPVNPKNSPKSEIEKIGLEEVVKKPEEPFTWLVKLGGLWYYQAIYADIATSESCVSCHNSHPASLRTDFKVGDVMGGIIINLPLGKQGEKSDREKHLFAPQVIADYVHSVLEADRTVYSQYVVDHLQSKGVVRVSENWWQENSLPLPAQFLLNASQRVQKSNRGVDFRLISLWPINPGNGPANEFEHRGLETVEIHPIRPYIGQSRVGRKHYFQAIYPDFAVTTGCIDCHNNHPESPKNTFRLNDVMGGIVVTLELE